MSIMSITIERNQAMNMKNPPHPGGVVLRQCIEPTGLTITDAAAALGVTRNTLSELVNGKRGISPEMAVRISQVFGGTEEGWLVQQAQYDLAETTSNSSDWQLPDLFPALPIDGLEKGPLRPSEMELPALD
jgi:addiction module HigA family antidote